MKFSVHLLVNVWWFILMISLFTTSRWMNILNYVLFFGALRKACLFAYHEKCTFCTDRVAFLGYVVTPQGIEMDEAKIEAIKNWLIPTTHTTSKFSWPCGILLAFRERFQHHCCTSQ
jgi:hypothetical protein